MEIKISEKCRKEFCQEVINVSTQYNKLLRKPKSKLKNYFKEWKIEITLALIMLIILIIDAVVYEMSLLTEIIIVALIFVIVLCFVMLHQYNKQLKVMLEDDKESTLTLNEEAIELKKPSITVKLPWENVAFARIFNESICFIPKSKTGMIISVDCKYLNEIKPYIKSTIYE